jgi:hypothetical protein
MYSVVNYENQLDILVSFPTVIRDAKLLQKKFCCYTPKSDTDLTFHTARNHSSFISVAAKSA